MPSTTAIPLPAGMTNVYSFDFEITKQITNCHENQRLLTDCVRNFMDNKFGPDYDTLIDKSSNLTSITFNGIDKIENITGCKRCCNQIRYKLNLVHSVQSKNMLDDSNLILQSFILG